MTKKIKILIWCCLLLVLLPGFRYFPKGNSWDIDNTSTTNSKLFITYSNGSDSLANNIKSNDSLSGTSNVSVDQIVSSIISDYNSINGAFVSLAPDSDTDFSARGTNRTITVSFGGTSGANGGEAQQITDSSGNVTGCEVSMLSSLLESADQLLFVLTHEIGHCLGLNHPQDLTQAIMSYYVDSDIRRLQIDDKMGLTFLYPAVPGAGEQKNTFGLSCQSQ
jgi:hypothetical protein